MEARIDHSAVVLQRGEVTLFNTVDATINEPGRFGGSACHLLYLHAGKLGIHFGRECQQQSEKSLIIIPPNVKVRITSIDNTHGLWVRLQSLKPLDELPNLLARLSKPECLTHHGELLSLFQDAYTNQLNLPTKDTMDQTKILMRTMTYAILQKLVKLNRKRLTTKIATLNRVENAKFMIDQSFTMKLSLSNLSKAVLMSKFALIRSFKEVFGITPHQYYVNQKLKYAKKLIANGASVKEAALESGYPNIFSFSKQFKEIEGFPPSRLRQSPMATY